MGGPQAAPRSPADRADLRTVSGVLLATFLSTIGVGALLPVLPRYVTGPLGAGEVMVGIVVGCYTITAVIVRPFAGGLSDRRGRRPVVLAGTTVCVVGALLLYAPAGVAALIVARLIFGAGLGSMNTVLNLWLVDAAPEGRRAQVVGMLGVAIWGGMAVGPLIGEALLTHVSYDAVWAVAVLAPLCAALVARSTPDPRPPTRGGRRGTILPRAAVRPGVSLMLCNVGWATASAFVILHLGERGIGGAATVLTAYGLAVVAARLLLGRVPDIIGPYRGVLAAGTAQATGLVVLAVAPHLPVAVVGGVILGLGTALAFPSLVLIVLDHARPEDRGAAVGVFTSFLDAGIGLGAPLAGLVAALAGYEAAFLVAAACAASGALVGATAGTARRAGEAA